MSAMPRLLPGQWLSVPKTWPQIGPATPTTRDPEYKEPRPKPEPCAKFEVQRGLLVPRGTVKVPTGLRRLPFKRGKPVSMRIVVDIQVKAKLNMALWGQLKLPEGWRKAPRQQWKNDNHFPVRIYTYQPPSLSAEQLENIQAQVALMEMT